MAFKNYFHICIDSSNNSSIETESNTDIGESNVDKDLATPLALLAC